MNKILAFCYILITSSTIMFAFDNVNFPMGIGPDIGYRMGMNTTDQGNLFKNSLAFSNMPDIGAQFYLPFEGTEKLGMLFNAGYYTIPYALTNSITDATINYYNNYIAFGADIYYMGFTAGLNYGLISSAKMEDYDLPTDNYNNMLEFRLGTHIPIMENSSGRLNLNARLGYFLTGLLVDQAVSGSYNINPVTLSVGISYLFNLIPEDDY